MNKILLALTLVCASGLAFAGEGQGQSASGTKQQQKQTTTVDSAAVAAANNSGSGNGNAVSVLAGGINCLVNCASTDQGSKDLADSAVQSALIQAQAARDVADTTVKIKNTPSVSGPALTSSNDTCMGSTSGSANVPGIGIGFGTSWVDNNCKMLKNSRELWNMGMKGAAMALMCNDPDNKAALELTGYECPQTTKARNGNAKVQQAAQAGQAEYTDPIVRARLGLPALK